MWYTASYNINHTGLINWPSFFNINNSCNNNRRLRPHRVLPRSPIYGLVRSNSVWPALKPFSLRYADPFNCRKYWRCTNNGVGGEHYTCEDDKLFDLKYMGCNFPYLVDCQDRPMRGRGDFYTFTWLCRPICDDCDENCEYKTTTPAVDNCEAHQCTQDGFFCETKCSC